MSVPAAPRGLRRRTLAFASLLLIAGCASNAPGNGAQQVNVLPGASRIVMMPPDIRYYLMTAGGNPELHETWTSDAESAFAKAVADIADLRGMTIDVPGRNQLSVEALRFEGLHAALGKALIEHAVDGSPLPSKGANLVTDWTLGPGVSVIRDETGADYALFVHYRENQASGSRLAFAILAAAAHVAIPTSSEHGFATLVDLDTGHVVWFAELFDDGHEFREEAGASVVAESLMQILPVRSTSFADAQVPE